MTIKPFKFNSYTTRTITADPIEFVWRGNDILIDLAWDCDSDGSVWSCPSFYMNGFHVEPYESFESEERNEEWLDLEMEAFDHRNFGWQPFSVEFLAMLEEALLTHIKQLDEMQA